MHCGVWRTRSGDGRNESGLQLHSVGPVVLQNCVTDHGGGRTHGPEYQALCRVHLWARITAGWRADVEQVPPTTDARERKRPQRIASPASEPVLRPTPTPVNVSLGAIAHSAPIATVLPTHLFSVAWLPRILGPRRSRDLANNALWACSDNPSADGRCVTGRIGLAHSADLNIAYSAHRPIEAYGGYSGPLPSPLHL